MYVSIYAKTVLGAIKRRGLHKILDDVKGNNIWENSDEGRLKHGRLKQVKEGLRGDKEDESKDPRHNVTHCGQIKGTFPHN